MKHRQEDYWRPRYHMPPLQAHPDPPPIIQCSWYPLEGQCPYMRLALICWRSNGECTFTDMRDSSQMPKNIWTASAKNCRMRRQPVSGSARSRRSLPCGKR